MSIFKKINIRLLIISLIYTAVLLASEVLYRNFLNITNIPIQKLPENFLFIFLFTLIFIGSRTKTIKFIVLIFFIISIIGNNIHYEIYRSWITPIHYYLSITEFGEVTKAGTALLEKLYIQLAWGTLDCLILLSSLFFIKQQNTKNNKHDYFIYLLILLFSFSLFKGFKAKQESIISPKIEYGRVKENYLTIGLFITRIIPSEIFDLNIVPYYLKEKPQKYNNSPEIKNIIFIVGESATSKHISSLGYNRKTTPFIDSLAQDKNTILKETISAGTLTFLSLPPLFNAIPYPNGNAQIESGNTNIFNLAKNNGFNTYFYSAQAEDQMRMINLLGSRWIDDIRFPSYWGYSIKDNMKDFKLLEPFYQIDLDKNYNLVILHQRGSHLPYGELLEEKDHIFGNTEMVDKYDNTIYNLDQFIQATYEYLQKRNKQDWILIYTSDHGQVAKKDIINQGNYYSDNYNVPLFIYSPNVNVMENLHKTFNQCKKATHQQLATTLINLVGYQMPIADCQTAYINGSLLSGDLGYYKITQPEEKLEYINPQTMK